MRCKDKGIDGEIRKLLKEGWRVISTKRHLKLAAPTGIKLTVSKTPSDRRAIRNFISDVRRIKSMECQ